MDLFIEHAGLQLRRNTWDRCLDVGVISLNQKKWPRSETVEDPGCENAWGSCRVSGERLEENQDKILSQKPGVVGEVKEEMNGSNRWEKPQHNPVSAKWKSLCHVSLWPHGLYSPWNSPGQNTGVGSHSLLQGIFPTQGLNPCLLHCRWILYQRNPTEQQLFKG